MELSGPRVRLRPLQPADFDAWRDVRERCADWLRPWEPRVPPVDGSAFADRCSKAKRDRAEDRGYGFGIFLGPRLVGEVNMSNVTRGAFHNATIGYWIDRDVAGRGLMPEAVTLVLAYAFDELGLHRVEINVIPRNAASKRVPEKLGIRCEGLSERYLKINGVWEDHLRFAITAEEWAERCAALSSVAAGT